MTLLLLLCPLLMQSQTCEECRIKNYSYPYTYCDPSTGAYVTNCSKDPNAPGLKPWKLCLPAPIVYDERSIPFSGLGLNEPPIIRLIFDTAAIPSILQSAYLKWASICSPYTDSNCQRCPITIRWSRDKRDFQGIGADTLPAYTQILTNGPTGAVCRVDCSGTFIVLNGTDKFMKRKEGSNDYPSNFFYTTESAPVFPTAQKYYTYLSLHLVVMHELGHLLGFQHTTSNCPLNGESGGVGVMSDSANKRSTILTEYDRCMFKTLYCCTSPLDVEEPATINSTFNIYPNPTFSDVTISLSASAAQYPKRLRVVDINGKTVLEQAFTAGSSDCVVKTNGLSKGTYLFVISFDGINGSYAEKVIIQ